MMDLRNFKSFTLLSGFLVVLSISFTGCSEDELFASVKINEVGSDLGGDVTGDGGNTTKTYTWNNPKSIADCNMDITSTLGGSFLLNIKDADGVIVFNETLTAGQGDDSMSKVTASGTTGPWAITVTLSNFNGDGSFSLNPGN